MEEGKMTYALITNAMNYLSGRFVKKMIRKRYKGR